MISVISIAVGIGLNYLPKSQILSMVMELLSGGIF